MLGDSAASRTVYDDLQEIEEAIFGGASVREPLPAFAVASSPTSIASSSPKAASRPVLRARRPAPTARELDLRLRKKRTAYAPPVWRQELDREQRWASTHLPCALERAHAGHLCVVGSGFL